MSRCFPFPPPYYQREQRSLTAESIKLQKEQEITEERRRNESKKEKKERKGKKEKKEKSEDKHESSKHKHKEHRHKKRKYDEINEPQTKDDNHKAASKAIEQLEKSGLTEELGLPCPTQEPCESSESTQNSSKSRKVEAATNNCGGQGNKVIRLRLPSQKLKDTGTTSVIDGPCFSGRTTSKDPVNLEPCFSAQDEASLKGDLGNNAHCESTSKMKNKALSEKYLGHLGNNVLSQSTSSINSCKTTEAPVEKISGSNAHSHFIPRIKSSKLTESSSKIKSKTTEAPLEKHLGDLGSNAVSQSTPNMKNGKTTEAPPGKHMGYLGNNSLSQSTSCINSSKTTVAPTEKIWANNVHSHSTSTIKSCKMNEVPMEKRLGECSHSLDDDMMKHSTSEGLMDCKFSDTSYSLSGAMVKCSKAAETPPEWKTSDKALSGYTPLVKCGKTTEVAMEQNLGDNAPSQSRSSSKSSKRARKKEKKVKQLSDLIVSWKPSPLVQDTDASMEDLGWLFNSSRQSSVNSDAQRCSSLSIACEDLSQGSAVSSFQPRACYLPQLEIYQLPYVIPY